MALPVITSNGISHLRPNETKVLKCPKCSFIAKGNGNLRLHSLIHQEKSFSCSQCTFVTKFQKLLNVHEETHVKTEAETFNCLECPYSSSRKCSFLRHTYVHMKSSPYKCYSCKFESFNLEEFEAHTKMHIEKRYTCVKCPYRTGEEQEFKCHLKEHASKEKISSKSCPDVSSEKLFMCALCQFNTKSCNGFEKHLLQYHKIKTSIGSSVLQSSSLLGTAEKKVDQGKKTEVNSKTNNFRKLKKNDIPGTNNMRGDVFRNKIGSSRTSGSRSKKSCVKTIQNSSKIRKRFNMQWPTKDKIEIYWCHVYSRHKSFERVGGSERRRKMLIERGILDSKKIGKTSDAGMDAIVSHMKYGKMPFTQQELDRIDSEVEEFMKGKRKAMRETRRIERENRLANAITSVPKEFPIISN